MSRRLSGGWLVAGTRPALKGGEPTLRLFRADLDAVISRYAQGTAMVIVHHKGPLASQAPIHVALRFEKPWAFTHDPDRKVVSETIFSVVKDTIRSSR